MSIQTDEWLATTRTTWKAGIDRDQREAEAVSAARLSRVVVPENERPSRRIGELLALAGCIAVCALRLMWLRHARSMPVGSIHEILAERAQETQTSPARPAGEARVPMTAPARAKSVAETLPPLPRPAASSERAQDDRDGSRRRASSCASSATGGCTRRRRRVGGQGSGGQGSGGHAGLFTICDGP